MKPTTVAVRQAYDDMILLAHEIASDVDDTRVQMSFVSKDLLAVWKLSDEKEREQIFQKLFAEAVVEKDDDILDHLGNLRALIGFEVFEAYYQHSEHFEDGLQATRRALDF